MEEGFDIGFTLGYLRKITHNLFGKKIAAEMQVLQDQIVILKNSLALLTTY
jgi:hypothetical protein